mmetsp:Transcript_22052/g.54547  ORF Transcript_22052/g.54547 Transcript_22052/m.54547 type:complete len:406 (+) Transcript_22052:155-1372(+)
MGLFGRKKKSKHRVSFEGEVDVDNGFSHLDTIEQEGLRDINNDNLPSDQPDSVGDILLPFREPRAPDRVPSLNSDINESNHQNTVEPVPMDDNFAEAEYMDDSDGMGEMEEMSADPLNISIDDYMTPQVAGLANQRNNGDIVNNKTATINKSNFGTTAMPSLPDLDKSQSARKANRGITSDGINRLTLMGMNNDAKSNSNSHSNSTQKVKGKTNSSRMKKNHDTNHSNQGSTTTTSSDSYGISKQMQQMQIQMQQQHYPEQQQLSQHEIQSEQTRELVKIFIGEIWNRGEIESIERVCSPRLRFNGHTGLERVGHDGFSRMVATVRSSLEGYHCEIHSMVVEGRKCFCRLKFTGKHVGLLMGYPPTNKLVAWMGASEFTICPRTRQILKVWELGDIKTLEAQLMG